MKVLVINIGSSSTKYQVFDMSDESVLAKGLIEWIGLENSKLKYYKDGCDPVVLNRQTENYEEAVEFIIKTLINPEYSVY